MQIVFFENKFGTSFELKPETTAEVATLARIAKSSRAEKPSITFYFSGDPSCTIWIRKTNEKSQINSITNKRSQ